MNDAITACLGVLRAVIGHLETGKLRLRDLDNEEFLEVVRPYGEALGNYFAGLSEDDRRVFREKRGIQGQTWRRRQCEKALRNEFEKFNPDGLDDFSGIRSGTFRNTRLNISYATSTLSSIACEVGITLTLTCFSLASRMPAMRQAPR
jgi:DNA sulfur modification protein DndB